MLVFLLQALGALALLARCGLSSRIHWKVALFDKEKDKSRDAVVPLHELADLSPAGGDLGPPLKVPKLIQAQVQPEVGVRDQTSTVAEQASGLAGSQSFAAEHSHHKAGAFSAAATEHSNRLGEAISGESGDKPTQAQTVEQAQAPATPISIPMLGGHKEQAVPASETTFRAQIVEQVRMWWAPIKVLLVGVTFLCVWCFWAHSSVGPVALAPPVEATALQEDLARSRGAPLPKSVQEEVHPLLGPEVGAQVSFDALAATRAQARLQASYS